MPPVTLHEVLEEGQRRGLIGPGPLHPQVHHARALGEAAGGAPADGPALDLGSGGGLPGLVLALAWPESTWVLLDSRRRSTAFLGEAVERLGLSARVQVLETRAETAGRDPAHRGHYELVTARGFASPAATAECASPLLRVGGSLVVSEPPDAAGERWPVDGLALVGLRFTASVPEGGASFATFQQVEPCSPRYPRRPGLPTKRPLFLQPRG